MSRRVSRRSLLVTFVATPVLLLAACVQPAVPAEGKPAATRAAAPAVTAPPPLQPASATTGTPVRSAGQVTTKAPPGTSDLMIATAADVSQLDPHMSTSFQDIAVSFNLFDTLTARDPDLKLIPRLATESEPEPDPGAAPRRPDRQSVLTPSSPERAGGP